MGTRTRLLEGYSVDAGADNIVVAAEGTNPGPRRNAVFQLNTGEEKTWTVIAPRVMKTVQSCQTVNWDTRLFLLATSFTNRRIDLQGPL